MGAYGTMAIFSLVAVQMRAYLLVATRFFSPVYLSSHLLQCDVIIHIPLTMIRILVFSLHRPANWQFLVVSKRIELQRCKRFDEMLPKTLEQA